jgi:alpha-tubulin suppressor-like RCC1 family protein
MIGRNALMINKNDDIFAIGINTTGIIGFGHKNPINNAIVVKQLCNKKTIDFDYGNKHMIAITEDNKIYIWGDNEFGQLGNGTNDNCFVSQMPEKLMDERIIDVCCGNWHSLVLSECGRIYAWGHNGCGQIGNECDNKCQLSIVNVNFSN